MSQNKFWYQCVDCGIEYDAKSIIYLCIECSKHNSANNPPKGVLKVHYDYNNLKGIDLITEYKAHNNNLLPLLPIYNIQSLGTLQVGNTPLYQFNKLSGSTSINLFFKDESHNPTYSLKDRASSMVSAFAKEHNINQIITASTGNAGSSLAGICASQNQEAIVLLPKSAPKAKLIQSAMYGAKLIPVNGTYDDCLTLSKQISDELGIYNRNTAYNPITIEGKKTISFELYSNFKGKLPDYIFVPVGDGCIISGLYKGFEDLLKLKLIEKIPTIVAVQAKGSAGIINNLETESFTLVASKTVADSIQVDVPQNFYMTRNFISQYKGATITVSDMEILEASSILSRNTGLFTEPASAAAFAGFINLQKQSIIDSKVTCLILLTGSGLKDSSSYSQQIKTNYSVEVDISEIKKLLV